jgi:23S rRNA (uridine2479-2'-O)-methyltransferase
MITGILCGRLGRGTGDGVQRITTRNARFQELHALLSNRTKRQRRGEFLVQGVRPINLAVEHGWELRALLYDANARLSDWATEQLSHVDSVYAVAPELMAELGDRDEAPELLAVIGLPPDDLDRIPLGTSSIVVLFDRPTSPGNIGTLARSADAFGAAGLIVTGHAADPYDPKAVRASTGSLFALPTVRVPSPAPVLEWARTAGLAIVGTDERGPVEAAEADLTGPLLLLVGNETTGLSVAWREAADLLVRITMAASAASSLNAATAASILLYEAARQRSHR